MAFRKAVGGLRSRRSIYLAFLIVGKLLNLLPHRAVFLILVGCDALQLPGRGRLCQAYFPYVVSYLADRPNFRFWSAPRTSFDGAAVRVLFGIGAYSEACERIVSAGLISASADLAYALLRSLFELGEFEKAREIVPLIKQEHVQSLARLAFLKAAFDMIGGDEPAALDSMFWACRNDFALLRPHQNIAARPSNTYFPNPLDFLCREPGRLFDLCNFAGQRVTHVGRGEVGVRLYERALDAQSELQGQMPPQLSSALETQLAKLGVSLGEFWLIPEEWSTQIGHLGMLDILFRMRELGWWSGRAVLVARPELIANPAFFRLFEELGKVVVIGETVSEQLGEELLSLQRWYGLNFNAFRLPDGRVVPWQDAGALAIAEWERQGRGHPLREAYDRVYGSAGTADAAFRQMRQAWGMGPEDWYVCLHTRDAAHYLEFNGTGQSHRNAPIETSLDAIRYVTAQGGWVIKLGGPNSPKLPPLERTIDYALSDFRSELMDIHLIRHARAFIGTTSGLTNVAISFGVPCAIVNAITTDAQLWNKNVRFALKPVRLRDGTMLTQRQLTSSPWRWRVFDAAVLGRSGAHPGNNSTEEILQTAKEVVELASGRAAEFEAGYDTEALLSRWQSQLSSAYYYGTSRPSLDFLARYRDEFLAGPPTEG
ncbi:TIGR04372 family glycosyltransferase [Bradyrhizobium sp. SZCCHNR3058]|uniref:TIGR04372 family glycosyltransferase n=1 Tax=Bradyrhizobium sp. SZCCHNR3058 TaxID=3057423 RepID=UPI0029163366|nr:TIGR04372 family glycosyltransferase [Bradyrhizobium sp. SZCCHNR3058]